MNEIIITGKALEVSPCEEGYDLVVLTGDVNDVPISIKTLIPKKNESLYDLLVKKPLLTCSLALEAKDDSLRFVVLKLAILKGEKKAKKEKV